MVALAEAWEAAPVALAKPSAWMAKAVESKVAAMVGSAMERISGVKTVVGRVLEVAALQVLALLVMSPVVLVDLVEAVVLQFNLHLEREL